MTYAIIGFGEIGQTLAKTFARKGIAVSVATTRDPESFASTAVVIGPGITPPRRSRRTALGQGPCRRVRRRQGGQGFNHLVAAVLDQGPAVQGGRRVMFLSSDDDDAAAQVGALAEDLGFAPIPLDGLSEGELLVQAHDKSWGRMIFKDLIRFGR